MAANAVVVRSPVSITKLQDILVEDVKGRRFRLEKYAGKILLIVNIAAFGEKSSKVYQQMNDLQEKYHGQLAVLGFACNQFHHSDHCSAEDLLLVLRHIQPGNDFYPTFEVFNNVEVNGKNAHPLFRFLRESLPLPSDDLHTFVDSAVDITWSPVCRNDVASNFEKFIVAPNGKPYRRYSSNIQIVNLQNDVQALIEKFKDYKPPEL